MRTRSSRAAATAAAAAGMVLAAATALTACGTGGPPTGDWSHEGDGRTTRHPIAAYQGAEHCDQETAHFLEWGTGKGMRVFARDPEGVLDDRWLAGRYDADVEMPRTARDTGYREDGWALWLTPGRDTAYVRTPDGVEAWPLMRSGYGCD